MVTAIVIIFLVALVAVVMFQVSATKRPCPFCRTMMPRKQTKCPHCQRAIPIGY